MMLYWSFIFTLVAAATAQKCYVTKISSDCRSEHRNALRNGNLKSFYRRCESDAGFYARCALCCEEDIPESTTTKVDEVT